MLGGHFLHECTQYGQAADAGIEGAENRPFIHAVLFAGSADLGTRVPLTSGSRRTSTPEHIDAFTYRKGVRYSPGGIDWCDRR